MAARKIQMAEKPSSKDGNIEELHRSVSRKESRDNNVITVTETTQILRRLRSSPRAKPVVQKVVLTKITKKDDNGTIIDETENEVVEDLNEKSGPFLMAFDVAPSRTLVEPKNSKITDLKDRETVKRTSSSSPTRSIKKRPSETVETEGSPRKNSFSHSTSLHVSPTLNKNSMPAKKVTSKTGDFTSKPGLREIAGLPGVMVRTVEIVRTVTVRDNDKPWRINSKQFAAAGKNTEKTTAAKSETAGHVEVRSPRNDLHGKVLKVVQKYVDSEGCALHGCKHSHEPEDQVEVEKRPRTRQVASSSSLRPKKLTTEPEFQKESKTTPMKHKLPLAELQRDASKTEKKIEIPAGSTERPTEKEGMNESHMLKENASDHLTKEADASRQAGHAEDETAVYNPHGYRSKLRLSLDREKFADSAPAESNTSREKLAVSPSLDSPAVVMRARSLFQSAEPSSSEENKNPSHFDSPKSGRKTSLTSAEPKRKVSEKSRRCSKDEKSAANVNEKTSVNRSSPLREAPTPVKDQQNLGARRKSPEPGVKSSPAKSQLVEDIDDLALLESMLNSAKGYDERSKIRAQIRAVKKKSQTNSERIPFSPGPDQRSSATERSDQDRTSQTDMGSENKGVKPKQPADSSRFAERRQSSPWRKSPEKELKNEREIPLRKSPQREYLPKEKSPGKDVQGPSPGVQDVVQEVPWRRKSSTSLPSTQTSPNPTGRPSDYPANGQPRNEDLRAEATAQLGTEEKKIDMGNKDSPRFRTSMLFPGLNDRSPGLTEANGHRDDPVREKKQSVKEDIRKQDSGSAVAESSQEETRPTAPSRPKANLRDSFIRHHDLDDSPLEPDSIRSETYALERQDSKTKQACPTREHTELNFSPTAVESAMKSAAEETSAKFPLRGQRRVSSTDVNTQYVTQTSTSFVLLNSSAPAALEDPTPWRRKSIPRESSAPPADSPQQENHPTVSAVKSIASKFQSPSKDTTPNSRHGSLPRKDDVVLKSVVYGEAGRIPEVELNGIQEPKTHSIESKDLPTLPNLTNFDQLQSNQSTDDKDIRTSSSVRKTSTETKKTVSSSNMRKTSSERKNSIPSSTRRTSIERKSSSTLISNYSVRRTSREASPEKVAIKLNERPATRPKSFLEDKTPVKGVQDIIQRMRATDSLTPDERRSDDDEARSLLNKFLGAQILVQCAEPLVCSHTPDLVETVVSSTQERSEERKISTSSVAKGKRSSLSEATDDQEKPWRRTSKTTAVTQKIITTQPNQRDMAEPCIVNGVDISTCEDDFKLNELLDSCNDYETRRKIRARIKVILSDPKRQNELAKNIGNLGRTAMTRTEVVATKSSFSSSTVRQNQPISAFTKFQQLDKNVKTTPSSPQNSPLAKEGQQFRLGEGLTRSASGVKDVLLKWCQARTAGYKNVQIENFSSSWNNGLAFCALIHHFYPDAFDYDQLKPENRAYNFGLAFKTAEEKAGIAPLLDVEDMVMMLRPDWKCVFTYVQSIYRRLKDD